MVALELVLRLDHHARAAELKGRVSTRTGPRSFTHRYAIVGL
jgi:hypothetical protein